MTDRSPVPAIGNPGAFSAYREADLVEVKAHPTQGDWTVRMLRDFDRRLAACERTGEPLFSFGPWPPPAPPRS